MAADRVNREILRWCWAALGPDGECPTDRELLEQYVACRDEAAFEALLLRRGPMVLGVCRRVLRNQADAEDAFQATFLVLVRKAQDRAAFQSLLADDFEGVNPRGYRFDKAGELKYVSNFCTTEYELKDTKVILLTRNSALVTYEVRYKVRPTGAQKIIENTTSHRTAAWVQRKGKWWRVYVEDRVAQK
jgi:hypothetical protein